MSSAPGGRLRVRGQLGTRTDTLGARILLCDVGQLPRPDLGTVDALARLQLVARRRGCRVRLANASPELVGLIDLAGLAGVLDVGSEAPRRSAGEVRRQAEQREEARGVEEERDARDPVAGELDHLE